eukprot:CAMPEP_0176494464 /NCGR_PEP_ID=MMETSP0200_2-20121128/10116_1 /TAXON_ID=947934 /ORGANISM="Chaetoceros sp., Strain GSL56" /LENGTH=148 /DNA_ID=CAMNT_0017892235 /DNA_START=47 /DNA_END=493 /DNA_ORIENTATION=+
MITTKTNSTILALFFILIVCSIISASLGFTLRTISKRSSVAKTKCTVFAPRYLYPGDDPGPPLNWTTSTPSEASNIANNDWVTKGGEEENTGSSLKANRWSKYAPDASLPTEEFRHQLKENMKNDLERRRAQSPNRGNQPAKSYLDSL